MRLLRLVRNDLKTAGHFGTIGHTIGQRSLLLFEPFEDVRNSRMGTTTHVRRMIKPTASTVIVIQSMLALFPPGVNPGNLRYSEFCLTLQLRSVFWTTWQVDGPAHHPNPSRPSGTACYRRCTGAA